MQMFLTVNITAVLVKLCQKDRGVRVYTSDILVLKLISVLVFILFTFL